MHKLLKKSMQILWPLILVLFVTIDQGLLFSNAQYHHHHHHQQSAPLIGSTAPISGQACDSSTLLRCQQDALKDMQLVDLNGASLQYPISSVGPPYSPAAKLREQQQASVVSQTICRRIRSNLNCMLITTAPCYETGLQLAMQNSDTILKAKQFLEQHRCNEPDTTWQATFCYRAPDIRQCEERYGFTAFSSTSLVANATACLAYQAFKYCIETYLRLNCKVHEMDMANEYLIDRAGDLAWRCPVNTTTNTALHYNSFGVSSAPYRTTDPYALSNQNGAILSPTGSSYGSSQYEQRPIPNYVGSSQSVDRLNLLTNSLTRDNQAWERFRSPYDDTRFGISRLPSGGSGEVFDRLVAGVGFDGDSGDCPVKAAPYARECEDTLLEQQRLARDSRDGNELQRRICCSLFQYRDCISRVVLDRCADSSPAAVEILMGIRRREMVLTCRGYNRDLCSGALVNALSNPLLVVAASLLALFVSFKQQQLVAW